MTSLSEQQFRALCDEAYRDRDLIYVFNPLAPHAETVLWTIMGSLFSLLSLKDDELPVIGKASTAAYGGAIITIIEKHRDENYSPQSILRELIDRIESDDQRGSV